MNGARYPSLADRRVVITGGATGIGAAIVEAFAGQGASTIFCDIDEAAGRELAERTGAVFCRCDLTDLDALSAFLAEADPVDVLVNNAASDDRHELGKLTAEDWDDRMAVNLRHLFFAAQGVAPSMSERGGGVIINLGSISWHLGLPDLVLYQTAKAAIEGLTRALARDLGRRGIRAVAIIPGNVQTPRQQRWYTPEGEAAIVAAQCLDGRVQPADVAALALFLASDDARMITGHEYFVDAGWR